MTTTRIHVADIPAQAQGLTLDGQPGQHVARVLRMRAGDDLVLFDGSGGEHAGRIESVQGDQVRVQLLAFDPVEREAPVPVTLLQGISRGERMDWTIQKATELGVHRILPVPTKRSMVKLKGERADRRREHWQAVATSACEQCGRNRIPRVESPLSLERALDLLPAGTLKLTLRGDAGTGPGELPERPGAVCIAIGPEGGLDPSEYRVLEQAGFAGLRLGPRILRTETAGLAALAALLTRWGDF